MKLNIAILPGDGIGVEVTYEAAKALQVISEKFGHDFVARHYAVGGKALDEHGTPLPPETLAGCLASDAVLLGAVGGPRYEQNPRGLKPEDGLLSLRREMGGYANLRPIVVYDELIEASPLKPDVVKGCDMLIVRELLGGLYFGTPRGFEGSSNAYYRAFNTMSYTAKEIERVAHTAFQTAARRNRKVTSVDKSNVLEVSQLWRSVVSRVANDYPQIQLEHLLVDNCAMQLVRDPRRFDVILTENMFGDILSDEAAVIAGSIGMLASASLGGRVDLYEPVHGSAPDIAGKGKANPIGAIASVAMMLDYSFNLKSEARAVERAIRAVIARGLRTADLAGAGSFVTTSQMGDAICSEISEQAQSGTLAAGH